MHLVGFIIRIYHDARSPERQKHEQIKITLEVSRLIQIAGEIVRVVVNWSLGRGVREKYRERERERENVGENIPDFVGCGHCLL